ncbi:MAG: 3-isopropylmalate dehydratase large subunit [Alphaproteobacteria bacterium]|nr:3-isopropylmalate dehydratase large subunit [Alphaproteobacteria bacterium]
MAAPGPPQTLAEKLVARAAGLAAVRPGEIVVCAVDLAMMHDSGGPRRVGPILERLGVGVWDASKVVVVTDHFTPAADAESAAILDLTRRWVRGQGIDAFYDMQGICHVVLPERGHLRPGMFAVGGDSHAPTGGAFGCYMFGVGATEMAGVLATGEIWLRVPETVSLVWEGAFAAGVSAKDAMLAMCARLGMDGGDYQAIEYSGSLIRALPMPERMTLCNMAAELGAQAGLIAPDAVTAAHLAECGVATGDIGDWRSDDAAAVRVRHRFDAGALSPQVAAPHSPANAAPVEDVPPVPVDQCYIGACTGAKLADLKMAAAVLAGRRAASGVRLLVAPASASTMGRAAADGTLATLTEAGAIVLPAGCNACGGYGAGVLAEGEVCIASTARNFKGRMGAGSSQVYLGSPYTVAAAAVAGHIADPRDLLGVSPEAA